MHHVMLAAVGLLGLFIGLHVILVVPSMWGYLGLLGGFTLFSLGVIQDYEGSDHV